MEMVIILFMFAILYVNVNAIYCCIIDSASMYSLFFNLLGIADFAAVGVVTTASSGLCLRIYVHTDVYLYLCLYVYLCVYFPALHSLSWYRYSDMIV